MTGVLASAPGKLVVSGDYAVLDGAPAVVLALDRRAHVELAGSPNDTFCVRAPDLDIHAAQGRFNEGRLHWDTDQATADQLSLVTCVLEALACTSTINPTGMTLDTSAFFSGPGEAKLGLGSSAALTVALAGAWHAALGLPAPELASLVAMHRQLQQGRGSGVDIAASLLGGALVYRLRDGRPTAERMTWPADLAWCCVWSGRIASTGAALARLADWRSQHPSAYATHMSELTVGATAIAAALEVGNATVMVERVAAYADRLAALGAASGIDIVCAEHRALADAARSCGVAYKTCGAGGGDIGVAMATDADRLTHFARQATAAGFRVLETGIDPQGLSSALPITSQRRSPWTTYA